jgi:peptidoglycan/LPS O-acetylase OafA/YrhL
VSAAHAGRPHAASRPDVADARDAAGAGDGRFVRVDQLRGLAALGVVFCHIGVSAYGDHADAATRAWTGLALTLGFGYIGVPLFFVLSGFCIHLPQARRAAASGAHAAPSWGRFYARRAWRLYPPYLGAMLLALLALAPLRGWPPAPWSTLGLESLLLHTFHTATFEGINPPAWTLAVEAQLYLAYPVVFWLIARGGAVAALCAVVAATMGYRLLLAFHPLPDGWGGPAWVFFLARWLEWTLGAAIAEWSAGRLSLPRRLFHPAFAAAVLALAIFLEWHTWHLGLYIVKEPMYGIAFALVLGAALQRPQLPATSRVGRILAELGLYSYSLYLLHRPIQLAFEPLAREASAWRFGVEHAIPASLLVMLCSAPVVLVVSKTFYSRCELPCIELARRAGRPPRWNRESTGSQGASHESELALVSDAVEVAGTAAGASVGSAGELETELQVQA